MPLTIAIAGGGIGALSCALALEREGHDVTVVEKARSFGDVGAGIQISPNASSILDGWDLAHELLAIGTTPARRVARRWSDDAILSASPLAQIPIERYGHAYYNAHRRDLIGILAAALRRVEVRFGCAAVGARGEQGSAFLDLDDGSSIEADVVIGADGIHSAVRSSLFGEQPSRFSGSVAYRSLLPREAVPDFAVEVTNRMGPDRHVVTYVVGDQQQYVNVVAVVPESSWAIESWTEPGDPDRLRAEFREWSAALQALLALVDEPVFRWALHDREPMETWTKGRVTLLGDACHPMLPFMAQGACQAIEDAYVLAFALRDVDRRASADSDRSVAAALQWYETLRIPRASELQRRSWNNRITYHLHDGEDQRRRDERMAADDGQGSDVLASMDWLWSPLAL